MRSTHFGFLSGLTAFLLGFASLSSLAQPKPNTVENQPGQAVNITPRPVIFGVDRSPMQYIVGARRDLFRAATQKRNIFAFAGLSKEPTYEELLNLLNSYNQKTTDINLRDFIQQLIAGNPAYSSVFVQGIETLDSNKNAPPEVKQAILEKERRRIKALFVYALIQNVDAALPLRESVLALERQDQLIAGQYQSAFNVLYSNAPLRSDFSVQYLTGNYNGFGFGANYDLIGYGFRFKSNHPETDPDVLGKLLGAGREFEETAKRLIDLVEEPGADYEEDVRLAKYVHRFHAGLSGQFQRLNDLGDFYSLGLIGSTLHPRRAWREDEQGRTSEAMFYSVALRHQWFEIDANLRANPLTAFSSTKSAGISAIIAWQDRSPQFYRTLEEGKSVSLKPWHSRYGIEYARNLAAASGDYWAVFGRWRDRHSTEAGLSLGLSQGSFAVGGSIGYYFK